VELYIHSPNTPSWRGAQLKHRDNFTFYHIKQITGSGFMRDNNVGRHSDKRLVTNVEGTSIVETWPEDNTTLKCL
jgi:hypothetical protein